MQTPDEKTTVPEDAIVMPPDDPEHEWNSAKYHSGKPCVGDGSLPDCTNPAGTAWSPYFCQKCNSIRLKRISTSLKNMLTPRYG